MSGLLAALDHYSLGVTFFQCHKQMFTGFYPITESKASYAGVLIASVIMQELARYGIWRIHKCEHFAVRGSEQFAVRGSEQHPASHAGRVNELAQHICLL
jgi:hypothetical protein